MLRFVILSLVGASLHPKKGGLEDVRGELSGLRARIAKETSDFDAAAAAIDTPAKSSLLEEGPETADSVAKEFLDAKDDAENDKHDEKMMSTLMKQLDDSTYRGKREAAKLEGERQNLITQANARDEKYDQMNSQIPESFIETDSKTNNNARSGMLGINDMLTALLNKVTGKVHAPMAVPTKVAETQDQPGSGLKVMQQKLAAQEQNFAADAQKDAEKFIAEIKSERGGPSSFVEISKPAKWEKKLEADKKHFHDLMTEELASYKEKQKGLFGSGTPPTRAEINKLDQDAETAGNQKVHDKLYDTKNHSPGALSHANAESDTEDHDDDESLIQVSEVVAPVTDEARFISQQNKYLSKMEDDKKKLHSTMHDLISGYEAKSKGILSNEHIPTRAEITHEEKDIDLEYDAEESAEHIHKKLHHIHHKTQNSLLQVAGTPQEDEASVGRELASAQDRFNALTSEIKKGAQKTHHDLCCERQEKCCWFKETTPAPLTSYDPVVPRDQIEEYTGTTQAPPDTGASMFAASMAEVRKPHKPVSRDTVLEFEKALKSEKGEDISAKKTTEDIENYGNQIKKDNESFEDELENGDQDASNKLEDRREHYRDDDIEPSSFMQMEEQLTPQEMNEKTREQLRDADRKFKARITAYERESAHPSSFIQTSGDGDDDHDALHPTPKKTTEQLQMQQSDDKLTDILQKETDENKRFSDKMAQLDKSDGDAASDDADASSFIQTDAVAAAVATAVARQKDLQLQNVDMSVDSNAGVLASWKTAIGEEESREHERTSALFKQLGMAVPSMSLLETGSKPSDYMAKEHNEFYSDQHKLEADLHQKSKAASDDLAGLDAAFEDMPQSLVEKKAPVKSSFIQKFDGYDPMAVSENYDTMTAPMIGVSDLDSAKEANGPTGDLNSPLDDSIDHDESTDLSTPYDESTDLSTPYDASTDLSTPTSWLQVDGNLREHQ